jgi:branched-chain amino acid transport system permease protein
MEELKKYVPFVVLVVVGSILPFAISNQFYVQSALYVLLYMYWASCWNILGGYTGLFSLGNGLYIGVGAYSCAVMFIYLGITPWIGVILAGLVAGFLSVVVGYPVFRLKGMYYSLAMLALVCVFGIVFNNQERILGFDTGGPMGLRVPMSLKAADMQFVDKRYYYFIVLGLLLIILAFSHWLTRSRLGYYFRSLRENEDAAASVGVNILRYKLTSHFISAFFTGVGGAVYAMINLFVGANIVFGIDMTFYMVIFCIVGGANTIWGPILGALLLVPVQQVLRIAVGSRFAPLSAMFFGLVLCLVILFMPDGLLGWFKKLLGNHKTQRAKRLQTRAEGVEPGGGGSV